tara:strand:+ start:59 stop:205 length:147 start_codon:yes stop_codon:yes gene_type:complete
MEPEEFGKLVKKIISDPKKLYAISLVLIILFPPLTLSLAFHNSKVGFL